MAVKIICADVMDGLRQLPDESVHCVVTSPPYFQLRDYGVEGQIGLEATPEAFITKMVEVFAEVRRVLRSDGTLWVNMGDGYAAGGVLGRKDTSDEALARRSKKFAAGTGNGSKVGVGAPKPFPQGLKPKDLIGMPWRLALALQADGWYLRRDIIWHKPNPMPESAGDRCTTAHEYLFHLTKSSQYFYDAAAIAEPRVSTGMPRTAGWASGDVPHTAVAHARDKGDAKTFRGGGKYTNGRNVSSEPVARDSHGNKPSELDTRNKRSVWTMATAPFSEAHFATFPPELPETCIKAGCPLDGTVLDPFSGAGTTCLVADRLQRNAIGIELNPEYAAMSERRINGDRGALLDIMEAS